MTEIGEMPTEWTLVKLRDSCNQRNEIIQPSGKGDHKFVGLEHIISGEMGIRSYQLDTDVKSSKFRFYRGDILYGKLRPYLDKAAIADFDGICSTDLLVLTTKNNIALTEFLIYLIHSNQFIQNSNFLNIRNKPSQNFLEGNKQISIWAAPSPRTAPHRRDTERR